MCGSVCFCLYKVHAHCDCCEAMHACVGVCVWDCTRRVLTDLFARPCMHVLERVCVGACVLYAQGDCCKAMNVCCSVRV